MILLLAALMAGCAEQPESDAYGQFEAEPVTVSAELGGMLLEYSVKEGQHLEKGGQIGLVDTISLALQIDELRAQQEAIRARVAGVEAETEVAREELLVAERDLERVRALSSGGAATQKQLDDAGGRVSTLEKRVQALEAQQRSARAEMGPLQARLHQVRDRLRKSHVINPVDGRVLTSMAERHELVGGGQALYEIASLDTLTLRVYVSGGQLAGITLGQEVEVLVDDSASSLRTLRGTVSWIASRSEFTPRMIQTREERVTQVYAVKIRVPNPDSFLKIGMPAEVNFSGSGEQQ